MVDMILNWIDVNDKLPDKYGWYIVTLNNTCTDFCQYYPDKKQFGVNDIPNDEVTAWMPMPEPYKGKNYSFADAIQELVDQNNDPSVRKIEDICFRVPKRNC